MRARILKIGFTAWLFIVILVVVVPLFYAAKEGYLNKTLAIPLGIILVVLLVLVRLMGLVKFIKTEGKKDIKEVFGLRKPRRESNIEGQLRKWEEENDSRLERLPASVRRRIESLEIAYINDTSAKTTLSLAKAYEESGLQDVAQLYYLKKA
jgi:hypothetical protein